MGVIELIRLFFGVAILQEIATRCTNSKIFSYQALVQNYLLAVVLQSIWEGASLWWILFPLLFKLGLNLAVSYGYFQENYVTTQYLYNDYFPTFVPISPGCEYYTEGLHANSKGVTGVQIMKDNQKNKFEWIIKKLSLSAGSKVLEIGFGNTDLMKFLRDMGVEVEGGNISQEQIDKATEEGLVAFRLNYTDLGQYTNLIGRYDAVITNGSLEYLRRYHESTICYDKICKEIRALLKPRGKWYASTLHYHEEFPAKKTWYNRFMLYLLSFGNEGGYPMVNYDLSKYAEKQEFSVQEREDHTSDYLEYSLLFGRCYVEASQNFTWYQWYQICWAHLLMVICHPNYVETVMCYHPGVMKDAWYHNSWIWQFLPQNGDTPIKLYWYIFEK